MRYLEKNELAGLKKGQFVMYCGETDFSDGFVRGETFEIVDVGNVGFRIHHQESGRNYNITCRMPIQSLNIKSYKVVMLSDCENDETELTLKDYELLIDYALEIRDLDWARELHAAGQKFVI